MTDITITALYRKKTNEIGFISTYDNRVHPIKSLQQVFTPASAFETYKKMKLKTNGFELTIFKLISYKNEEKTKFEGIIM